MECSCDFCKLRAAMLKLKGAVIEEARPYLMPFIRWMDSVLKRAP